MKEKRCLGCMETYTSDYTVCPHCGYVEGTPADEAVHMAPGTVLEGRYVMGKVLGYGGFGATYIAWDPVLEHKVAIKEYLPSEFSTRMPGEATVTVFGGDRSEQFREGMEKFVEEAKRLSQFRNEPGIVKIFDSFQANSTAYIVMEYLDGETLTAYLEREGTVSEEKVMEMLLPVMYSLKVVHSEGLLHRDIAPDNIFITKSGEVKLIDFGASRYATTSHSRSLTVIIKPGYSPEEQYRSHGDQGPHTDVYALAAVMYKMLTGITPPDALERRAMIETKKKELLPDVHKEAKYVSPIIENAVLNAMNIQIEDRTADIPSFLAELQAEKPAKRRYGKIKKIDVYAWPLWLKIVIPAVLIASLTTVGLLVTGVIAFPSLFSGKIVVPEGMVIVPNVEQMKSEEAMQTLQDVGLTPIPSGNVESSYVETGLILLQTPLGGSFANLGSEIQLTVSSGNEVKSPVNGIATVPYVVWNTQEEAEAKLQKAGLKATISTAYDSNVAAGMVISQSLEANQQVSVNTEVALVISLGKENSDSQQPSQQPSSQPTSSHAEHCPFKNGAYVDVMAREEGTLDTCYLHQWDDKNDLSTHKYLHRRSSGNRVISYIYDINAKLVGKQVSTYAGAAYSSPEIEHVSEQYDSVGNVTYKTVRNNSGNYTYSYNAAGKLTNQNEYQYDSAGNVIKRTEYGYVYNATGQVIEQSHIAEYNAAGERVGYSYSCYDDAGNLLQRNDQKYGPGGKVIKDEAYDRLGNLIRVYEYSYDSAGVIQKEYMCEYDSAGRMTRKSDVDYVAGIINRRNTHDYDASGNVTFHTVDEFNASGNIAKTTVYDKDGNLVNSFEYDTNGNIIN